MILFFMGGVLTSLTKNKGIRASKEIKEATIIIVFIENPKNQNKKITNKVPITPPEVSKA